MILYFADRSMKILGMASTSLPEGMTIKDDKKEEDVDTGVGIFSCFICFDRGEQLKAEDALEVGNYLLRSNGNEHEFYTIIDSELDSKNREMYVYAEDAGLDLLNTVALSMEFKQPHTIAWYIMNRFAVDSGFEIGINEIPTYTRTLKWDGESTATERIASLANSFGAEISYSYEIEGLEVKHKYINIYKKRGQDIGVELRVNEHIDNIKAKKSIANLATALYVTGGIPKGKEAPITLSGYRYDDGDIYVSGKYLCSRKAVARWSRYASKNETGAGKGHIEKSYSYNTTSQKTLCSKAVAKLKKVREVEVNYEADVLVWPDNVGIGDRVNIIDDENEFYLSTRILKLESSETKGERKATFGEYLIKDSGIHDKVAELAARFADAESDRRFYTWIAYADDAVGTGISLEPAGKAFLGIAQNQVTEDPVLSDPAEYEWVPITGTGGAESAILRITSSQGINFREKIDTRLKVIIYKGSTKIENLAELMLAFGATARLVWQETSAGEILPVAADDPRLAEDGFLFDVSINERSLYTCSIETEVAP